MTKKYKRGNKKIIRSGTWSKERGKFKDHSFLLLSKKESDKNGQKTATAGTAKRN
jgi:hypothetical protein